MKIHVVRDMTEAQSRESLVVTVLLVDDDKLLRKLFTKRLEHVGYEVHNAANGKMGFEMAEQIQPNLILLDYHMPILNGDLMLEQLRQTAWGQDIPVIMMSAVSSLDHVTNLHQANKVMYKPITNKELLTAIHAILEHEI